MPSLVGYIVTVHVTVLLKQYIQYVASQMLVCGHLLTCTCNVISSGYFVFYSCHGKMCFILGIQLNDFLHLTDFETAVSCFLLIGNRNNKL